MPDLIRSAPWLTESWIAPPSRSRIMEATWYFQGRAALNKQNIPSPQGGFLLFNYPDVFWQPANPYVGNSFVAGNKDCLFIQNTNLSQPRTVIVYSVPEPVFGRSGNVCITVDPGATIVAYPIPKLGFMQADGTIWLLGQTAEILFLPLTFS